MTGRCVWMVAVSLALAGGCGKKDGTSTSSPDAGAVAANPDADPAPADGPPSDDGVTGGDEDTDVSDGEDQAPESLKAVVKLKLKRGGKTLEHPGYVVDRDEEITILMTQGSRTHEIDFLYTAADSGYDVQITYRDNGRQVLQGSTHTDKQQWFELKSKDGKTTLSVYLDPDVARVDDVEMSEGDDPLGGV